MVSRPYWTGQIRISLVSLAITLQSAIRRSSQVPLHEIDRDTGERIRHQNINEDGKPVERDHIVKGYEVDKEQYVILEEGEIDTIRLPSSDTLELSDFVDVAAVPILNFERPYFVLPANKKAEEIYDVFAEALRSSGKLGIGQITLRGREELCAVMSYQGGLVVETLRYQSELFEPPERFLARSPKEAKGSYVTLAQQLIEENTHGLQLDKFHDHYHEALKDLIEAKQKHRKPRFTGNKKEPAQIVDFAEALRQSLKSKAPKASKAAAAKPVKKRKRS